MHELEDTELTENGIVEYLAHLGTFGKAFQFLCVAGIESNVITD